MKKIFTLFAAALTAISASATFYAFDGTTQLFGVETNTTPTALENTTATVKAQKAIENGQMIVIRDGKKFNAVGAKL